MKFIVGETRLFWWPVEVKVPSATQAGTFDVQAFEVQFEALGRDEAKAHDEALRLDPALASDPAGTEIAVLKRVVKNWRGVTGADDQPLGCDETSLSAVLGFAYIRRGVYDAYRAAMSGEAARTKN